MYDIWFLHLDQSFVYSLENRWCGIYEGHIDIKGTFSDVAEVCSNDEKCKGFMYDPYGGGSMCEYFYPCRYCFLLKRYKAYVKVPGNAAVD